MPDVDGIYKFLAMIFKAERLDAECGIMCLAYIERMITLTGLTLDPVNWRRIVLSALILASKVSCLPLSFLSLLDFPSSFLLYFFLSASCLLICACFSFLSSFSPFSWHIPTKIHSSNLAFLGLGGSVSVERGFPSCVWQLDCSRSKQVGEAIFSIVTIQRVSHCISICKILLWAQNIFQIRLHSFPSSTSRQIECQTFRSMYNLSLFVYLSTTNSVLTITY